MAVQAALRDLCELIRYQAAVRPERVAMTFEGRETTYGQLDRRASRVANGLLASCPTPQTRVALLDKNSDQFFEVLFGATKARDVLVAVNWRLAPAEIAYIVNDAMAEVLFVGEEYFPVVEQLRPELPMVKQVIALSGHHPEWEPYAGWRDRQVGTDPGLAASGDDVAMQLYTSGTTGHPKGAQLTHDYLMTSLLDAAREWYGCRSDDVSLICMPQFHYGGSVVGLIALYAGGRDVITRQLEPTEILRLIPAEGVTVAVFVPAVLLFLLQTPGCRETDFSSLRRVVYSASPIPLDLLREAMATFKCGFGQVYGLTETGVVTFLPPADHDPAGNPRMRSCGKPIGNAEIKVVDTNDVELPPGQVVGSLRAVRHQAAEVLAAAELMLCDLFDPLRDLAERLPVGRQRPLDRQPADPFEGGQILAHHVQSRIGHEAHVGRRPAEQVVASQHQPPGRLVDADVARRVARRPDGLEAV
jgi:acyl-CoA synthetase (AMP-forming)/AMP-acid ligase II